jgi:hypothetical protein
MNEPGDCFLLIWIINTKIVIHENGAYAERREGSKETGSVALKKHKNQSEPDNHANENASLPILHRTLSVVVTRGGPCGRFQPFRSVK